MHRLPLHPPRPCLCSFSGLLGKRVNISGCLRGPSGFLQKTEIPKPVEVAIGPCTKRNPAARRQPTTVTAVSVNMHFEIWDPGLQHSGEIVCRPKGVDTVARSCGGNETGWNI